MNILEPISRLAERHPGLPALILDGKHVSYGELWRTCGGIAWHLMQQGIQPGQRIAVGEMSPDRTLLLVLSVAYMGASTMSLSARLPQALRDEILRKTGAAAWIVTAAPELQSAAVPVMAESSVLRGLPSGATAPALVTGLHDAVWRILQSSGTTGRPKRIPWTHGQSALLQRTAMDVYPTGPRDRLLMLADLNIGFALNHAMQQLSGGGTLVLPRSGEPQRVLETIRRDAPTRVLSTPSLFELFTTHLESLPLEQRPDTGSLLAVMLGGAVVTPKLRERVAALFCPNVVVNYGSTEMGGTARLDMAAYLEAPDSTGRLMPWVDAQVVDEEGAVLPAGSVGRLRLRAPAMASGYMDNPEATAAAFRDGWYYPGDRARIDNGILTLAGRADDVINVGGVKLDPAAMEAALARHPAVREAGVVALSHVNDASRLAFVVAGVPGSVVPPAQELRARVESETGPLLTDVLVFAVERLPRTPMGKLDRKGLVALVQSGLMKQPPETPS